METPNNLDPIQYRTCLYCQKNMARARINRKYIRNSTADEPFEVVLIRREPHLMADFAGHACKPCIKAGCPKVLTSETDLDSYAMTRGSLDDHANKR